MAILIPLFWRLCVSHRTLNSFTLCFKFSFPRYTDSIKKLGSSCCCVSIVSLDARSRYNQLSIWKSDGIFFFFNSCATKNVFKVIPFELKNFPTIYTTMIQSSERMDVYIYQDKVCYHNKYIITRYCMQ